MSKPKIQFLAFAGCPLADAARESLEEALADVGLNEYEEIDLLDPNTPEETKGWGSPTILIDGEDVTGNPKGNSIGCRIYPGPSNVPSSASIGAAIRQARE